MPGDTILAQHTPSAGESKSDFMSRCQAGGRSRDECALIFDRARGRMAFAAPATAPAMIDGKTFEKDIISVGTYHHPATGKPTDVTIERMNQWIAAFDEMTRNGSPVPIVSDHEDGSDAVLGYITGMRIDGKKLRAVHNMTGERGVSRANESTNVSIAIAPDFKDGKGHAYGEVIEHVAVCKRGVVTEQEPFVAMSVDGVVQRVPLLLLQKQEGNQMDLLNDIRTALGAGDDLTEENAAQRVADRLAAALSDKQEVDKKNILLEGKLKTLEGSPKPASAMSADEHQTDPHVIELTAESNLERIDACVKAGNLIPVSATALKAAIVGEPGARNVTMLSIPKGGSLSDSGARLIIDAIAMNDPVKLGEQTAAQALELPRVIPGEDDTELSAEDKEKLIDKMVAMAPGNNGSK